MKISFLLMLILVISCSKIEKKEIVQEQTRVEGEFTSNELSENSEKEIPFDMDEFQEDQFDQYKIKKGDSLLTISFNLYGDYQKWHVLKYFNQQLDEKILLPGEFLNYPLPKNRFVWRPKGRPYMILNGDTLTGISLKKYRDALKWKMIWDNNKPLIKNPDYIFAGFTIYYIPDPKVIELASLSQMGKIPIYKSQLKVVEETELVEVKEEVKTTNIVESEKKASRAPASIGAPEMETELSAEVISNDQIPSESAN